MICKLFVFRHAETFDNSREVFSAGVIQYLLWRDFRRRRKSLNNSSDAELIILLPRILDEPEKHLKSYSKTARKLQFSWTIDSSNVAMACFKVEARKELPTKILIYTLKLIEAMTSFHPKEKVWVWLKNGCFRFWSSSEIGLGKREEMWLFRVTATLYAQLDGSSNIWTWSRCFSLRAHRTV